MTTHTDKNTPSREQIALALLIILDGRDNYDLIGWTGCPEEECEKITEIRDQLAKEFPEWFKASL